MASPVAVKRSNVVQPRLDLAQFLAGIPGRFDENLSCLCVSPAAQDLQIFTGACNICVDELPLELGKRLLERRTFGRVLFSHTCSVAVKATSRCYRGASA